MLYNPPSGSTDPNAPYVGKNVTDGQQGSKVPISAVEAPQRELVALITESGQTPTNSDLAQGMRAVRGGQLTTFTDTSTAANQIIVTPKTAHQALIKGLPLRIFPAITNTGAVSIKVNALTAALKTLAGNDPAAGDVVAGKPIDVVHDGTNFIALRPLTSEIVALVGLNTTVISGADTGPGPNSIVVATPAPSVSALRVDLVLVVVPASVNTGATNITVAGFGAKPVIYPNGSAFLGGEMQPRPQIFVYDGTSWEWQGQQSPVLQQATTFYVSPGGNNSNNGLTVGSPLKDILAAVNRTALFNLNGFNVTIVVADGTYAGPITLPAISGSGTVTIQGNLATPGNVIVNSNTQGFLSGGTGKYTIAGLRIITIGNGFQLGTGADWTLQNIDYGPCSAAHISVDGGTATLAGTQNISGNAVVHAGATNGGTIKVPSAAYPTLTFTTGGTFSSAFILASVGAKMGLIYASITGAGIASGPRFNVASNAVINTNGGGANYYPGSSAGVQSTGGQYI